MYYLFLVAETVNPEHLTDQIFLGVAHEICKASHHDDGYTNIVISWQGNCMEQIEYRCENLDDVVDYYIC